LNVNEQKYGGRAVSLDWGLIAAAAGLMAFGVVFIYSAGMANESNRLLPWFKQNHFKQLLWIEFGLLAAIGFCLFSYQRLSRWAVVAYWLCILLLVLVLVPGIGTLRYGARRWLDLGPVQVQPSEFAKLALIMVLAHYLSRPVDELRQSAVFWRAVGLIALPFFLIIREPDLGSALILIPTGLVMLGVAGIPARFMSKILLAGGALAALLMVDILFAPPNWRLKLEDYQRRRLMVFFGLNYTNFASAHATAAEMQRLRLQQQNDQYNSRQALISVGSGGLTGKGWRQGSQIALGYLPRAVAHNDFIFSVIAEESGFMGSVGVVALYGVILLAGLRIASQARDRLGKLLAVGVVTLLFCQVFINIGMNIRLMPVTGVPLPLISYGGSSVLSSLIALGLLQNVHIHQSD